MSKPKINLIVVDQRTDHIVLTFARPGRVELSTVNGEVIAMVYEGTDLDLEQEPLFGYDGTTSLNQDVTA